jgi:chromosome segregation ATPase
LVETRSKFAEIEQQLKDISDAKQQLQVQNIDLLAEVDSLKIEKESLESEIKSNLSEKKSQLDINADKLIEEIQSKEASILESQEINRQLNENLVEWQNSNSAIEQQILLLQQQNTKLSEKLGEEIEKSKLQSNIVDLKSQVGFYSQNKDLEVVELHSKLQSLTSIVSSFGEERLNFESKSQSMQSRIDELISQLSDSRKENESLKAHIGELDAEIVLLKEKLNAEEEHVHEFHSNVNSIISEYHDMVAKKNAERAAEVEAEASAKEKKPGNYILFLIFILLLFINLLDSIKTRA